jgi:hypothetical protein
VITAAPVLMLYQPVVESGSLMPWVSVGAVRSTLTAALVSLALLPATSVTVKVCVRLMPSPKVKLLLDGELLSRPEPPTLSLAVEL